MHLDLLGDEAQRRDHASECFIEVRVVPAEPRAAREVALRTARALALPLGDAAQLLTRLPVTLPRAFAASAANDWLDALRDAGAAAGLVAGRFAAGPCDTHPALLSDGRCARCERATCVLCSAYAKGERLCGECLRKQGRSRAFYRARVAVLLAVLACVLLWAWRDVAGRSARTSWQEPLRVGLVLVRQGEVDGDAIRELRVRARALQAHLAEEFQRYRSARGEPFHFVVYGPVDARATPPVPRGDGWLDDARYSYALWRYLSPIDDAAGVAPRGLDSRLYLLLRPPSDQPLRTVEGAGEEGGRIGMVEVELDDTMVDFALFVAAHELLHTLGATDKYDAAGHVQVPDGLAEPGRVPLYPQRYAELMARHVALSPTRERPPDSLDELRVGAATAREIGWFGPVE